MEVKSWLTGNRGGSLPFTDDCEPTQVDPTEFEALYDAARQHGIENSWRTLECRGGVSSVPGATPSTSFYGHRLDLTQTHSELFRELCALSPASHPESKAERPHDREVNGPWGSVRLLRPALPHSETPRTPPATQKDVREHPPGYTGQWSRHRRIRPPRRQAFAGALFVHFGTHAIFKFGASTVDELSAPAPTTWSCGKRSSTWPNKDCRPSISAEPPSERRSP